MTVHTTLSVNLASNGGNELNVTYDHGAASTDAEVDFVMPGSGGRVSVSLDEAQEFAEAITAFVDHHRTATR